MQIDRYLEKYNEELRRSLTSVTLLDFFLYESLSVLIIVTLFTIGVLNITSAFILQDINFPLITILGIVLTGSLTLLSTKMWADQRTTPYTLKNILTILSLSLIWLLITTVCCILGFMIVKIILGLLFSLFPLLVSSFFTAVLFIGVILPLVAFLFSYFHIIILDEIRHSKTPVLSEQMYIHCLYISFAFSLITILSVFFKVFSLEIEAFLTGVLLLLFFTWHKSYINTIIP